MRKVVARVHRGFSWLFFVGILVQVYFAGMFLFGAGSPSFHEGWGYASWLLTPVPVALAVLGGLGRRLVVLSLALLLLTTIQVHLPHFRLAIPWVSALHPVNAAAMLGVALAVATARPAPAPDTRERRAEAAGVAAVR